MFLTPSAQHFGFDNCQHFGFTDSSTGVATVTGTGSQWNSSSGLYVGGNSSSEGGSGVLNIQNGGGVTVGTTLKLWSEGSVNLSGGELNVSILDLQTSGATEHFNMTGGRLSADLIMGDFMQEGGVLDIGDSPGLTVMQDDFDMAAGEIEFEINGFDRGVDFDAIDIGGIATLSGTMDIDLINGFSGSLDDSFQLIDADGGILGMPTFDFSDSNLGSGLAWDTSDFITNGSISITSAVPEPSSLLILGLGCCLLGFRRRK